VAATTTPAPVTSTAGTVPTEITLPAPTTAKADTPAVTAVVPVSAMAKSTATPASAESVPPAAKPGMPVPTAAAPMAGTSGAAQPVASVTRTADTPSLVPAAPAVPQTDAPAYEVKGRRDPFTMLDVVTGPTGLTVATTKLTGIVRGNSTLALVETSDGIGYILRTGDTLGDGRLVEIGADNVVFAVAAKPGAPPSRVVLKLAAK
jgi:hypothetical protein